MRGLYRNGELLQVGDKVDVLRARISRFMMIGRISAPCRTSGGIIQEILTFDPLSQDQSWLVAECDGSSLAQYCTP